MPKETYSGPSVDFLKSLPPEAYRIIPFAQPPPNVEANFENPPTRVPVILGVSITYLIIATLSLGIRAHVKIAIAKNWKWDDTLVVLGFMFSIAYFSGVVMGCRGGAAGRHEWDVHLDQAIGHASLMQSYMCTTMSTPALGLIKMSLFIQYYHLFGVMCYVRISVYVIGALTAMFYLSVSITAFVLNGPWPGESLLDGMLSWHYLIFAKFSIPGGVIGMMVDWTLLILPIPAVWSLNISRQKKLGVMLIFMTGALGAVASVISLYYRVLLQNYPTDTTWKVGYTLLWIQVEMWSGVTASCMPSVKHFCSYYIPTASQVTTLGPSTSHFRRSTREEIPDANGIFRKWGYNSNADTESATHITQGSGGTRMKDLTADSIVLTHTAS
ncbi:hypothetical protein K505DRAFT_355625 [Melanomma pulvis-pyrius CBS 109.77]|uniref:Rhodopsin domain-containing protein n=1 Tax=Melanomma pulvis-pyrius CBS 109.77 TaxID=1314802 RepID=A0A6A6XXR8_9PLEO|nr:hypothetical protein K505DRAFT_355625 [Melanomma pulvis-pyrius CBS 109.77]